MGAVLPGVVRGRFFEGLCKHWKDGRKQTVRISECRLCSNLGRGFGELCGWNCDVLNVEIPEFTVEFIGDECEFAGWHEGGWPKQLMIHWQCLMVKWETRQWGGAGKSRFGGGITHLISEMLSFSDTLVILEAVYEPSIPGAGHTNWKNQHHRNGI